MYVAYLAQQCPPFPSVFFVYTPSAKKIVLEGLFLNETVKMGIIHTFHIFYPFDVFSVKIHFQIF